MMSNSSQIERSQTSSLKEATPFSFNADNELKYKALLKKYPQKEALMLPLLWLVQEQEGWISPIAMRYVADMLDKAPMEVYQVATFYTMYNKAPIGRVHIELCKTLSCMLCGARELKAHIKDKLGISPGETTSDNGFTLSEVECMGACGGAPALAFNGKYYEKVTPDRLDELLEQPEHRHI